MRDDGFHDEQEYLEYICREAEEHYYESLEYDDYTDEMETLMKMKISMRIWSGE